MNQWISGCNAGLAGWAKWAMAHPIFYGIYQYAQNHQPTIHLINSLDQSKYLLYKAEKPSVRPSVCLSDHHAGISAMLVSIKMGHARNES